MTTATVTQRIPFIERDGGRMPVIGLGTAELSGTQCREMVRTALETGYRHLDTARRYGNERAVGQGIKDSGVEREEIFLTTKLEGNLNRDRVRESCGRSLDDLDTPYIDLLLIHWPEESMPLPDILEAMAELKDEGLIRHLGVSNFTVKLMEQAVAAINDSIFCNQVEYHPHIDQRPVLQFCRAHDMALVAYSPLARGRSVKDSKLAEIGRKYGKSATQAALRWLVSQKGVAAIPKGSSEQHIRDNLDIFDFELDRNDFDAICRLGGNMRLIDPDSSPKWDT
jgi:2,5-diketo-D-gluconate reductase B